jgi:hypothetical protein
VWFNGHVHVFLRVSNLEFLVEQWDRCGRVVRGIVNGLLLVMVSLLLVINSDGICIPPLYAGLWLYWQLGGAMSYVVGM